MADIVPFIASIIAIGAAITSMVIAWKKTPQELKIINADTAAKYQQIAVIAAEKALKTAVEALDYEKRIEELECRVGELERENKCLRNENMDIREWSERLVYQVKALGAEPVKLRQNE